MMSRKRLTYGAFALILLTGLLRSKEIVREVAYLPECARNGERDWTEISHSLNINADLTLEQRDFIYESIKNRYGFNQLQLKYLEAVVLREYDKSGKRPFCIDPHSVHAIKSTINEYTVSFRGPDTSLGPTNLKARRFPLAVVMEIQDPTIRTIFLNSWGYNLGDGHINQNVLSEVLSGPDDPLIIALEFHAAQLAYWSKHADPDVIASKISPDVLVNDLFAGITFASLDGGEYLAEQTYMDDMSAARLALAEQHDLSSLERGFLMVVAGDSPVSVSVDP